MIKKNKQYKSVMAWCQV